MRKTSPNRSERVANLTSKHIHKQHGDYLSNKTYLFKTVYGNNWEKYRKISAKLRKCFDFVVLLESTVRCRLDQILCAVLLITGLRLLSIGWFVCALLAGRGGRVAAGVGGSLSDRGASLTGPRSLAADLSVKSQQFVCVQFDVSWFSETNKYYSHL